MLLNEFPGRIKIFNCFYRNVLHGDWERDLIPTLTDSGTDSLESLIIDKHKDKLLGYHLVIGRTNVRPCFASVTSIQAPFESTCRVP